MRNENLKGKIGRWRRELIAVGPPKPLAWKDTDRVEGEKGADHGSP